MLCMLSVTAQTKVVYVRLSGDDTNSGLEWNDAKATVQAAVKLAKESDQVWVAKGNYSAKITIFRSGCELYGGFSGKETSVAQRDWNKNVTILNGDGKEGIYIHNINGEHPVRIDGFKIQNIKNSLGAIVCSGPVVVCNNLISNVVDGACINCFSCSGVIYNNKLIQNECGSFGAILCDQGSMKICNNVISDNKGNYGAGISLSKGNHEVFNNTVCNNKGNYCGGIFIEGGTSCIMANNIVAFNGKVGVFAYSGAYVDKDHFLPKIKYNISDTVALRNNCIYGHKNDYRGLMKGSGDISVDPKFVMCKAGDYDLLPTSPCIDAGHNDLEDIPEYDIAGNRRKQGNAIDMGAYEYCSGEAIGAAVKTY